MGIFSGGGDNQIEINVVLEGEQATAQAAKLGDEIEKLGTTAVETSGGFSELERKIISTNQAAELGEKVGKALVSALKALPNLLIDLANAGDKLGDLSESFEALGGSSLAIEQASARINGILPNIDLLALANKAMVAGIPEVNKNFGDLAEYGRKMGDALGIDAKQAIEQLTQALVSGRPIALKQLGIMIDSDKAAKDYAQAMGIVGRELSETEKKAAITAQGLDQIRENLGKMPATSDSVVDGLDAIKSQFTNLIGETGKAINENQDLTIELRKLANTLGDVDAKELASDLAELTSGFVKLATNGLSVAIDGLESFTNWLRVVKNLGGETSPVLDHLKTGLERTGQLAKKVFGGAYDEATDLLGAVVGWDKAQAKANKQLEDQAKGIGKVVDKEEELQLLLKDQQQLHEEELKRLKQEAEERDKADKALKANTKAREENEKAQKQAAETADKALNGLQKEIRDFAKSEDLANLQKALTIAFEVGDAGAIEALQNDISKAVYQGVIDGHEQAGGTFNDENLDAIRERARQETGEYVKEAQEEAKKNKWSIFDTILGGAFSDQSIDRARQQMESVASSIETSIANAISIGLEGGFNSETLSGLTSSLGQAIGSAYGGPIGGAFGGFYGQKLGESASKIGNNTQDTISGIGQTLDMILPIFMGAFSAIAAGINGIVGGSLSKNEQALKGLDRWIEEKLAVGQESGSGTALNLSGIDTGSFLQDGNWSESFWASFDSRAVTSFSGLGEGLTQIAGITEDVGGQLGYILANNLNGNLDQARMLLIEMGIGAEDLEAAFLQIGLSGEQSWHTVETYMQSINDLTGEGLIGIGDLEGGMQQFIASGGRGQEALISLRNIAIEGIEAGATSLADLRTKLEASGKYTVTQLDAIFGALDSRGITTLDGLRDASDRMLGGVTADAESLGFAWDENVSEGMKESIKDVKELKTVINELPEDTEKNIVIKVRTEYSGDDAKRAYSDLTSSAGVARS